MKKDFSVELAKAISEMKPIRPIGRPRKEPEPEELQEQEATSPDSWDCDPPLPFDEAMRIARCDLPYSVHVGGEFRLRPGATPTTITRMLESALDGRPNTPENLLKLYRHMEKSFSSGGIALACGALFAELTRILREQGKLPPDTARRYSILEELKAEGRLD